MPLTVKPLDPAHFRAVLGSYPTGVTIITSASGEHSYGLVMGSFGAVSLDPPLVQFMPQSNGRTWRDIEKTGQFCVNVLAAGQSELCRRFFIKQGDPFATTKWHKSANGLPRLAGCLAWIECQIAETIAAGDHFIIVGRVLELERSGCDGPLLFHRGDYGSFTGLKGASPPLRSGHFDPL